jgi:thermostable 8-oxoguanine DNA glycosylase
MIQLDFIGQPTKEKTPQEQYQFWSDDLTVHGHWQLSLAAQGKPQTPEKPVDYSMANNLFNSFDSEEVEGYKSYWQSIAPKNDTEEFQRWLFAFMSVHTTWERNVIGYEAIKDWTVWFNDDKKLMEIIKGAAVGLHNNRVRFISQFARKFWANPSAYKHQGGSWQDFRNKLVKSILGLGIAKVSFALEMIYPNEAKVTCMDTHLFQAFGLDQSKDARRYIEIENYWLGMCAMWNVPSTIARAILWDRKQDKTDSRYWTYVLED